MAREAHVFDRGSGVARHAPLIAERRAAMAREANVFHRGSGVARHTSSIAEHSVAQHNSALRSSALRCVEQHKHREAPRSTAQLCVAALRFEEQDDVCTFRHMLTKVTHDHRGAERSWRPHAESAYNSPLEIEILKFVLGPYSSSTAKLCSSPGPEHILALPAKLCFSLGLEHKWRWQFQNAKRRSERRTENHASG